MLIEYAHRKVVYHYATTNLHCQMNKINLIRLHPLNTRKSAVHPIHNRYASFSTHPVGAEC